ncbi:MAG: nitroreductase family protein [Saccharofermentanales bacterium]
MARDFQYDIMPEIKARWSPRAFSPDAVTRDDLMALIEAARYAPSCYNEQPWRFLIADDDSRLEKMRRVLTDSNREWAGKAPVLILVLSVKTFADKGNENRWHLFDAGTAWGFLSLEAHRRGLITHAMGGFSVRRAREEFDIADEMDIITVIAAGHPGDIDGLSPANRVREFPQSRKAAEELLI